MWKLRCSQPASQEGSDTALSNLLMPRGCQTGVLPESVHALYLTQRVQWSVRRARNTVQACELHVEPVNCLNHHCRLLAACLPSPPPPPTVMQVCPTRCFDCSREVQHQQWTVPMSMSRIWKGFYHCDSHLLKGAKNIGIVGLSLIGLKLWVYTYVHAARCPAGFGAADRHLTMQN